MSLKLKARILHDGCRTFERGDHRVLLTPMPNDRWLLTAYGHGCIIEEFNGKSKAFQWVEAFFEFALPLAA